MDVWDSDGWLSNLCILLECAVSLMWLSYRQVVGKIVLNLGALVSGWIQRECYSTFAFLNFGKAEVSIFEVFNFPPKFASKGATGMGIAKAVPVLFPFWPCYS